MSYGGPLLMFSVQCPVLGLSKRIKSGGGKVLFFWETLSVSSTYTYKKPLPYIFMPIYTYIWSNLMSFFFSLQFEPFVIRIVVSPTSLLHIKSRESELRSLLCSVIWIIDRILLSSTWHLGYKSTYHVCQKSWIQIETISIVSRY